MNFEQTVDYIVIGGGASGCVIANRLSANQGTGVLLLEAGAMDSDPGIHNLTGFVPLWGGDLDWKFVTVKQPGLGGRELTISQGKVIGGGSSIHAMMFVRGNRINFDQWKAWGMRVGAMRMYCPISRNRKTLTAELRITMGLVGL